MKIQCWIGLLLLAGLVAGAAAGEDTPPSLPHEFYGTVTIGGTTAVPAGTREPACRSMRPAIWLGTRLSS